MLWTKIFGTTSGDGGEHVEQTKDGGYVISGKFSVDYIWLIKTDSSGDTAWTKIFYGGGYPTSGSCVQQTEDGGYIVVGHAFNPPNYVDVWLIKTDSLGDLQWEKKLGGDGRDYRIWPTVW